MKFLFISHAEKDSKLIKAFVELLFHIGVKPENIFCSSISELGVPIKEDIYDYLRNLLDSEEIIPIFMLSPNYYTSAACLNEMGAVWLRQNDYYTFLLPDFSFKEIRGAINPNKRAIKLTNSRIKLQNELTSFKNSICALFGLESISEQRWEQYRNTFIDLISENDQVPSITFDINESQPYCIGDVNHGASKVTIDKTCNKILFEVDFRKTCAKLCSFVLFTGDINLQKAFNSGRKIEFELKASGKIKEITIEWHLSSTNPFKLIYPTDEWHKYSIALSEFSNLENVWECCKELCFVADRNSAKRGIIEIKDIKII